MMLRYPIVMTPDSNDTFLVTSPDFPEVGTFGNDESEAAVAAADAIATAIAGRIDAREPVPDPSPIVGPFAVLTTSDTLKVALYQAMRADGIGKAQLARRLGCHLPQIDRLLDLEHDSRLESLETALRALGREIETRVVHAA